MNKLNPLFSLWKHLESVSDFLPPPISLEVLRRIIAWLQGLELRQKSKNRRGTMKGTEMETFEQDDESRR